MEDVERQSNKSAGHPVPYLALM